MVNDVQFHPTREGLYQAIVNGKKIPLLLAEHQVIAALKLLQPFQSWTKEDGEVTMLDDHYEDLNTDDEDDPYFFEDQDDIGTPDDEDIHEWDPD
jgi:hypothetical protein